MITKASQQQWDEIENVSNTVLLRVTLLISQMTRSSGRL